MVVEDNAYTFWTLLGAFYIHIQTNIACGQASIFHNLNLLKGASICAQNSVVDIFELEQKFLQTN